MKKCLFLCLIIPLVSGCAVLGLKVAYPSKVDSAMEAAFSVAEAHYKNKRLSSALAAYQKYIDVYPYNRLTDESYYKIGKIHFLQQEWDAGVLAFQMLANKTPDPEYRAKAYLLASHALFKKGDPGASNLFLEKIKPDDLPGKLKLRYYSLQVLVGQKLAVAKQDLDYFFLRMADLYQETSDPRLEKLSDADLFSKQAAMEKLQSFVISPISADRIPAWMHDYRGGYSRAFVEYKLGKIYYEGEKKDKARSQLSRFIQSYPKNKYADSAKKMLEELGGEIKSASGKHLKIGVLLPLSGTGAPFGEATLRGIKCASGEQGGCQKMMGQVFSETPEVELVVRDGGMDATRIVSMVDQLVDEGVAAIIGPMSALLAVEASERAQDVKVVLMPITQKANIMEVGDYIFQMSYEADQQIKDLVSQARGRGLRTFGVFYPGNNYGREMAKMFKETVEASSGKVVSQASYDPGSPDISSAARQLKLGLNRVSYGGSSGFDALFVPDVYWMMGRIIPALQLVTITGIPLLGTSAWNDPKLPVEQFADYPGSFYMDLFHPEDGRSLTGQFSSTFSASYGRAPTSIEALGFDAAAMLIQASQRAGSIKSGKIRDSLLGGGFKGVTGIGGFSEAMGPIIHAQVISVTQMSVAQ